LPKASAVEAISKRGGNQKKKHMKRPPAGSRLRQKERAWSSGKKELSRKNRNPEGDEPKKGAARVPGSALKRIGKKTEKKGGKRTCLRKSSGGSLPRGQGREPKTRYVTMVDHARCGVN